MGSLGKFFTRFWEQYFPSSAEFLQQVFELQNQYQSFVNSSFGKSKKIKFWEF